MSAFDPSNVRAEAEATKDRIEALSAQLEDARANGNEVEVRSLRSLLDHARERWRETEGVAALCDAVALTDAQPEGWRDLERCQRALYELLYRHGVDEIGALEVVDARPSQVRVVGRITWVESQSEDRVEATFTFDEDSRAIETLVVRAGLEDPGLNASPVAGLPESDSRWVVVIRAPSC